MNTYFGITQVEFILLKLRDNFETLNLWHFDHPRFRACLQSDAAKKIRVWRIPVKNIEKSFAKEAFNV